MFRRIMDWLVKLLLSIYNNKTAREMAMSALKTAAVEFKDAAAKTLEAVREANCKNMSGAQKYAYVAARVKGEYTEIPNAALNQLIENAVGILLSEDVEVFDAEDSENEEDYPKV